MAFRLVDHDLGSGHRLDSPATSHVVEVNVGNNEGLNIMRMDLEGLQSLLEEGGLTPIPRVDEDKPSCSSDQVDIACPETKRVKC